MKELQYIFCVLVSAVLCSDSFPNQMYIVKQAEPSATIHSLVNTDTAQISQQLSYFVWVIYNIKSWLQVFNSSKSQPREKQVKEDGFIPEKTDRKR